MIKVDLNNAKITDADLKHLEKFTELEWLDVRVTPIGDEGVAHLSGLTKTEVLECLSYQHVGQGARRVARIDRARDAC